MRRFFALLLLACGAHSQAEHIAQAEYAIDTDPGIGLATPIQLPQGYRELTYELTLPLPSLPHGPHTLYLRVQDTMGQWGGTRTVPFIKMPGTSGSVSANVSKVAVAYDAEALPSEHIVHRSTSGTRRDKASLAVDVPPLPTGPATAYVWVSNEAGEWGAAREVPFVFVPDSFAVHASPAVAYGYRIESDAGETLSQGVHQRGSEGLDTTDELTLPIGSNTTIEQHTVYLWPFYKDGRAGSEFSTPVYLNYGNYDAWADTTFTSAQRSAGLDRWYKDADGDGCLNLKEYAFDTDPHNPTDAYPDAHGLRIESTVSDEGDQLVLRLKVRSPVSIIGPDIFSSGGLLYAVKQSHTPSSTSDWLSLRDGSILGVSAPPSARTLPAAGQRHDIVTITLLTDEDTARFFRVDLLQQPQ